MTKKQALCVIRKIRPEKITDLRGIFSYRLIGSGCFREAYLLDGKWVIKFTTKGSPKCHTKREIKRVQQITSSRKLRHLVRYMPEVYYEDAKNGVVMMEYLSKLQSKHRPMMEIIERMFNDSLRSRWGGDMHALNSGINKRGQIKILDLGLI